MKILVGMSGGVDSACAAKILIDKGHQVEGCVLVMHEHTDIESARHCCDSIGIKLHVLDCKTPFSNIIKENFVSEYLNARTPNPCILCNAKIKFKYLFEYAMGMGFDAIATGHYASLVRVDSSLNEIGAYSFQDTLPEGEAVTLKVGDDRAKDQTYMLYRVPPYVFKRLVLPLSCMTKNEVRALAEKYNIPSANKPDSQEICFIQNESYADFIERRVGKLPKGNFISPDGKILGTHDGIIRYTVGQRKGLGISASSRIFVTDINPETNDITLSPEDKYSMTVHLLSVCLVALPECNEPRTIRLSVKLRYAKSATPATVTIHKDFATVVLDTPQRAVTPGQSAVFYKDDLLVGGGIII